MKTYILVNDAYHRDILLKLHKIEDCEFPEDYCNVCRRRNGPRCCKSHGDLKQVCRTNSDLFCMHNCVLIQIP